MRSSLFCGLDLGSTTTELVVVDESGATVAAQAAPTGADGPAAAAALRSRLPAEREPAFTVATGYGRRAVESDRALTEITCLALGAVDQAPAVAGVLDVGGQDAKFVWLSPAGRPAGFALNDRCAAGTGRFLELVARLCAVPLEEWGALEPAAGELQLSATCGVFAESEIVAALARGTAPGELVAAAARSIARRLVGLVAAAGRPRREPAAGIALAGGVADNPLVVACLREEFARRELTLRPLARPAFTVALGAALAARRLARRSAAPQGG